MLSQEMHEYSSNVIRYVGPGTSRALPTTVSSCCVQAHCMSSPLQHAANHRCCCCCCFGGGSMAGQRKQHQLDTLAYCTDTAEARSTAQQWQQMLSAIASHARTKHGHTTESDRMQALARVSSKPDGFRSRTSRPLRNAYNHNCNVMFHARHRHKHYITTHRRSCGWRRAACLARTACSSCRQ
jgi:hypothetical protein